MSSTDIARLEALRIKRSELHTEIRAEMAQSELEKRDLYPDEQKRVDAKFAEFDQLTAEIEALERKDSAPTMTRSQALGSVEPTGIGNDRRSIEERLDEEILSVRPGETRALAGSGADPITPLQIATSLFDLLRPRSAALASGIKTISTGRDSVTWPKLTGDIVPAWTSENTAITASDPTFSTVTATPRKLAGLVQVSNEVLDDSDPSAAEVLRNNLATVLGLKLDFGIFEGTGTAPQIRGLKNVAGIQTVSLGTNGAQLTSLDPIADAIGLLETANAVGPYVVVAHPRNWATLRKLKETTNAQLLNATPAVDAPNALFGARVFTTSQLTLTETQGSSSDTNSIYVYAPSEIVLVRRQDAQIELDRSRLFNQDASEIRGKLRADLIVPNPTAVVRIQGVKP